MFQVIELKVTFKKCLSNEVEKQQRNNNKPKSNRFRENLGRLRWIDDKFEKHTQKVSRCNVAYERFSQSVISISTRQFGAECDAASISFHLNVVLLTFMVNGMGNT